MLSYNDKNKYKDYDKNNSQLLNYTKLTFNKHELNKTLLLDHYSVIGQKEKSIINEIVSGIHNYQSFTTI